MAAISFREVYMECNEMIYCISVKGMLRNYPTGMM